MEPCFGRKNGVLFPKGLLSNDIAMQNRGFASFPLDGVPVPVDLDDDAAPLTDHDRPLNAEGGRMDVSNIPWWGS
jgi:hypothetical protein